MALILEKMQEYYNFLCYDLADDRTRDMFPSPPFFCITLLSYLYFCKSLGPRLMQNVKPFELKNVMLIYNFIQILACGVLFYLCLTGGWINEYSWTCQPVDRTENPNSRRMLYAVWGYTVIKLVDLMDTVFFVLRKKDRQISFLHVFHHFMMPIASYWALKYYPNGHGTFIGLINCIVHIVMYTYYLIAGLGPEYKKYLWWKKYVTIMQLVQFCIVFVHNLSAIYEDCGFPRWISVLLCIHSLEFMYLFGKFYYNTYIVKSKKNHENAVTNGKTKVK